MSELTKTSTEIRQHIKANQHAPHSLCGGGVHKRVPTQLNGSPRSDRYVILTTVRLFATTLHAVALVDGTGRLADPTSLTLTASLHKARNAANQLVKRHGPSTQPPTPPTSARHYMPEGTYTRTRPEAPTTTEQED